MKVFVEEGFLFGARGACGRGGELDQGDAEGEEDEGDPFLEGEGAVQHCDAEEGCCEDFELVRYLERRCVEIGYGDVLQIVLELENAYKATDWGKGVKGDCIQCRGRRGWLISMHRRPLFRPTEVPATMACSP